MAATVAVDLERFEAAPSLLLGIIANSEQIAVVVDSYFALNLRILARDGRDTPRLIAVTS